MFRRRVIALLLLTLAAATAHADYKQSFKNGVTAADKRRWAEVASAMRAAIAENPQESSQKIMIYGTRYVEYTPHFYLGLALARQNNCADAIGPLQTSERQGVATRTANKGALQQLLSTCAGAAPAPEPPPEERPAPVPAPVEPVIQPPRVETPKPQPTPTPAPARPTVQPARPILQERPPQPVPSPPAIDPQLVEASRGLSERISEARQLLAGTPASPGNTRARSALESALRNASVENTSTSPARVRAAATFLGNAAEEFRKATTKIIPGVDPRLAEGIRAYLRGEYQRVVSVLGGGQFSDATARAQAALFRAAARYALFALGGEKDGGLRQLIVADLREYRRLQPTRPDARLFPPPFRALYSEIR